MIPTDIPYSAHLSARANELSTLAVHGGEPAEGEGPLDAPLVLSSAFRFDSPEQAADAFAGKNDAYIYGRWGNPSVETLEAKVAAFEHTEAACATASGMAAIAGAVMTYCEPGSHIVAPQSMYAESARLFRERLVRFGITTTFVRGTDPAAYAEAIRPETRILYIETPANPTLAIADIDAVVALAKLRGLLTIADNTFATPFCQTPIDLGVDLVIHSMTKSIGGHGDATGGVVCGNVEAVTKIRDLIVKGFGGVLSPFSAYLIARGARTLPLRQAQACATTATLAAKLAEHPLVRVVHHPSLEQHPGRTVAAKQMHAFGSQLSFELRNTTDVSALDRGREFLRRMRVISHAVSLGDVRTLATHPASTTHSTMPPDVRKEALIDDGLIRLSIGLEGANDLWSDIERSLT